MLFLVSEFLEVLSMLVTHSRGVYYIFISGLEAGALIDIFLV